MEIILGKTAGSCFGVKNAIDKAEQELEKNANIYCLGELVHNKQTIEELEEKGMIFVDNIEDAKEKVIIRAHGEPEETYNKAKKMDIEIIDLTCPKVLKIHKIVKEYTAKGYYMFLTGKINHPEVIGIIGFCGSNYSLVEKKEDIEECIKKFQNSDCKKALLLSQTTFSLEKFNSVKEELEKTIEQIEVINTICLATKLRQEETAEISKKVDAMIIIGGKNSSNTNKLYEIAIKNCTNTFFIETAEEMDIEKISKHHLIGIMAGASTPEKSIRKVIDILKQI